MLHCVQNWTYLPSSHAERHRFLSFLGAWLSVFSLRLGATLQEPFPDPELFSFCVAIQSSVDTLALSKGEWGSESKQKWEGRMNNTSYVEKYIEVRYWNHISLPVSENQKKKRLMQNTDWVYKLLINILLKT